jgi:hypothetical protein
VGNHHDWRKSSHSNVNTSQCVETASTGSSVLVRDTANRDGGTLNFSTGTWRKFLTGLKTA